MTEKQENLISFAEIVHGGDSSIRVTNDGMIYAVDLVMLVTGKNRNHSNECIRTLSKSLFDICHIQMRDRIRLVSLEHAIQLVMVLPGKGAKESRSLFADIIKRYINDNKFMHSPLNTPAVIVQPMSTYPSDASFSGIKRGFNEIDVDQRQDMEFVCKSFDLQEEALEMRHYKDMAFKKNENADLVEMISENESLRSENTEAEVQIERLKTRMTILQMEIPGVTEELNTISESLRILSEPLINELDLK
jgi:hypothetical protein